MREGVHQFIVYDAQEFTGTWTERIATAATLTQNAPQARPVPYGVISDRRQVFAKLQEIQADGLGEGVMLRNNDVTHYERGRTGNLLKVKYSHPAMFTLDFHRVGRRGVTQTNNNRKYITA